MDAMVIMLMEKEAGSGTLVREVGSYTVEKYGDLIEGFFLIEEDEKAVLHMRITVEKDVEDWEFSAIYDEYNPEVFGEHLLSFDELDDTYNPTWEITFDFTDNQTTMERTLNIILDTHRKELDRVLGVIVGNRSNYE